MFGLGARSFGIDLGTANTLVFVKGKGIVVREPSVVAMKTETNQIIAIGNEAKNMIGRTPGNIVTVCPIKDGVIADYETTTTMMNHFIKEAHKKSILRSKQYVMVCVPSGVTTIEKRAVINAARQAGARDAFLIEEAFAAAIGSGLPVWEPIGSMVVDIGAGTTEVAVISLGGIVISHSIRVAGNEMDKSIISYIRKKYKLIIGERTAENIKMEIGAVGDIEGIAGMEVRGRDQLTGLPKIINIRAEDVRNALKDTVYSIINSVKSTLENTPPELAADIMDNGIILTGGGALLGNLGKAISEVTQIQVHIADDPLDCIAIGIGISLENIHLFKTKEK